MNQIRSAIRLYFWIVLVAIICWLGYLLSQTNLYNSDFRVFYSSGYILRTQPQSLYSQELQSSIQQQFFPHADTAFYTLSFINPPYLALVFAPLSLLPAQLAFYVWVGCNTLVLIGCVYLLKLNLSFQSPFLQLLITVTCFVPVFVAFKNGQTSLFTLFLLLLIDYQLKKKKRVLAGFLTSLLWYKPQIAVFLSLYWILQQKSRYLLGVVFGGIALLVISILLLGLNNPSFVSTFLGYVFTSSPEHSKEAMISWQGFFWQLHHYLPTLSPSHLTVLATGLTLLIVGVWAYRKKLHLYPSDQVLAFLLPLILLCGIHVHVHDAVLLLIPLSKLLSSHRHRDVFIAVAGYFIFLLAYFSPFYPSVFPFVPTLYLVGFVFLMGNRLRHQIEVV